MGEQTGSSIAILMGSDSDLPVMAEAAAVLRKLEVPFRLDVTSAHRSPEKAAQFAAGARDRGVKVIIAGAGHAAHLAGAMAAALNRLRTMRDAPSQLPENLTAFGIRGEGLMKLMATHPPLEERIARLQAQS